MTKKRKRRRPDQVVKLLQEGQVMRAVGKSEAEVFPAAREYGVHMAAVGQIAAVAHMAAVGQMAADGQAVWWHEIRRSKASSRG